MSYQAAQPQVQGPQYTVAHRASVGRKPTGQTQPGALQQAASPGLSYQSHSSTGSTWSPQSIGSLQSSPAQTTAVPGSMAQPMPQYAATSYSPLCTMCNTDVSNDSGHLECLACTSVGQKTLFCTPCCVTRAALGTHHHHMSNFVSVSDTPVHDAAVIAQGWDARKSGIGVTWYQHRATKIKTFTRPSVQPVVHPPHHAHSHIPVHTQMQPMQPVQYLQQTQRMQTTQQPMPRAQTMQPMQPIQHMQQPQQQPQLAQQTQPMFQAQPFQAQPMQSAQIQPKQALSSKDQFGFVARAFDQPSAPSQPVQALSTREQFGFVAKALEEPKPTSQIVQPTSTVESDLAPGWEEIKDPDGRIFYYYRATKLSMWTAPVSPLPQGWVMLKNPDGRVYYSNPTLGLMQWTRPTAAVSTGSLPPASTNPGQATFAETVNWSAKNSVQGMSPAQDLSPGSTRDWQGLPPSNSRRSSTLSTQSRSQIVSLQEDEFSSLKRPISSGLGRAPSARLVQQPQMEQPMQQFKMAQPMQQVTMQQPQTEQPMQQFTMQQPQMEQPMQQFTTQQPQMQQPPSMQQPSNLASCSPENTHSQGFTQQPVFGAQPQGPAHSYIHQPRGPAQAQQFGGPQRSVSGSAQNLQQPDTAQNQQHVQPTQSRSINQQPAPKKSSLTPQQKSALVNTGIKVGSSLLRTAIRASLSGDSGNNNYDFGGNDVSLDLGSVDFEGSLFGDTTGDATGGSVFGDNTGDSFGDATGGSIFGDANGGSTFGDNTFGDTSFTDTVFGSTQVPGGDQNFAQIDNSQFSFTDQSTAPVDVDINVNVVSDGSIGTGSPGNFANDPQYGPVDIGAGNTRGIFDSQYGAGNNISSVGSAVKAGYNEPQVQIGANPSSGHRNQGPSSVMADTTSSTTKNVQVDTATPDYEGAGYGPITPAHGDFVETSEEQDSNSQQGEAQVQGDASAINIPDEKAGQEIWIDPDNNPTPTKPYNPLTSASLSGPLTDFYDGFEPMGTHTPSELESGSAGGEPYPDAPMFPSLKRPPTQVDALFPTSSPPLPQNDAPITAELPDHLRDGPTSVSSPAMSASDPAASTKLQHRADEPVELPHTSEVQTGSATAPQTTPQTSPGTTPQTLPSPVPFEPPLNISPTRMNPVR